MRAEPDRFVLDAFALLAFLKDEPARPKVEAVLEDAARGKCELFLSVINLGEVAYDLERRLGLQAALDALGAIDRMPIDVVAVTRRLALGAARLKANHSLGYADCFAAALARELRAAVLTGDREFSAVEGMVRVEWLPLA